MLPTETNGFKENLVLGRINKTVPVYKLCELYNTTRKTLCKWVNRFKELVGEVGLKELSRAPKKVWNKKLVCRARARRTTEQNAKRPSKLYHSCNQTKIGFA